jgi:uncharacterized protein YrrD
MDTKIQFQKNATVLTANGHPLGSLHRVVVNPVSKALAGIVVRTGSLLHPEEKVVPIDLIAETTGEKVLLHSHPDTPESFEPFEERRIVESNPNLDHHTDLPNMPLVALGKPDLGMTMLPPEPGEQFITAIEKNIPAGTVAVKEGANIITAEGRYAGSMESVFADPGATQITHLLISNGLIAREKKMIPIHWVMTMDEDEIHLRVEKSSIEELADVSIGD